MSEDKVKSSKVNNLPTYTEKAQCANCRRKQGVNIPQGKPKLDENMISNRCNRCGNNELTFQESKLRQFKKIGAERSIGNKSGEDVYPDNLRLD